ncbi:MAG: peptide ABC transporter substrate-binding protein [Chloroflexota bacterium]|nr:peptide ABC transporter substrate-binding protein [Chloroflexota bacterium]
MREKHNLRGGFLFALLCLSITLIAAACTTSTNRDNQTTVAPDSQQILRLPIGSTDFTTLDPALVQDGGDVEAIQTLFTGLVQFDNKGNIKDQLAASHVISPDGLRYTFTLRPDLKFSDGTPLTAEDVAYSINRTLLPATQSPVTNYLNLIKDYDKITGGQIKTLIGDSLIVKDPRTLVIVLKQAQAYFLQTLTYPTSYVVERKLIDSYGKKWTDHLSEGGGAGPFKVASYSHTLGLDVVPDSFYYGRQPRLKKIEFRISGDVNTTYEAYLSNQYDEAAIPISQLDSAKQRPDYIHTPSLVLSMIQLNYNIKPFDILKIRQAFDVAIDRDLITRNLLRGVVTPTHRYIPTGMYGANPQVVKGPDGTAGTAGDRAQAVALLQQGLQDGGYSNLNSLPVITLTTWNTPGSLKMANVLVDQWKTILGVTVHVNSIDPNQYEQTIGTGNLQAWMYAWQADYPDPHDWLVVFFGKGQDYNSMHFGQNSSRMAREQQALQNMMVQADMLKDPGTRANVYNEIEQKLASETAWIPLYQATSNFLRSPRVRGIVDNPLGVINPDDWANIYMTI